MLQGWLLEPSARFSFVDGSSMAVRRCHGVTGLNGCWLSIRVCALSWRKRLTKDQSMIAPPCDLCSMKWFQSTPLEPLWPMPSSTESATTGTSVNRLARRASFRLNEASCIPNNGRGRKEEHHRDLATGRRCEIKQRRSRDH